MKLSMMDTFHGRPNHFSTMAKSVSMISQLILKMILKRDTDSGDFAITTKPGATIDACYCVVYVQPFCE